MFSISTTSTFINTFDPMMGSMILILGDVPIPLFLRLESSTKPCPITALARNHIHAVPNHVAFTLSRKFAKKNPIPSEDLSTPPVRTSTSALHFFLSVLVSLSVQVLCPAALERCAGIRPLLKLQGGAQAWEACMLPLHYRHSCSCDGFRFVCLSFLLEPLRASALMSLGGLRFFRCSLLFASFSQVT